MKGTLRRQSGQGLVEYSLILVLVALIVVVMLLTTGGQMKNVYSNVTAALCTTAAWCPGV
jgi:pilus assembly protein Flp/PilA